MLLQSKLKYFREHLQKFRDKQNELLNREKDLHGFRIGQLVYIFQPRGSILWSGDRKCSVDFVGLLIIFKCVSPNQFILMSSNGKIYPFLIEEARP